MLGADLFLPAIEWPGGSPENTAIIIGVVAGAYAGAVWLAALIWTIRDVRERSEDPITQGVAFLIVLVFNLPGWVLYMVLRPPMTLADVYERQLEEEALRQELDDRLSCPTCERDVLEEYIACPHCGTRLKSPCHECSKAVSFSWAVCPWCGTAPQAERKMGSIAAAAEDVGGRTTVDEPLISDRPLTSEQETLEPTTAPDSLGSPVGARLIQTTETEAARAGKSKPSPFRRSEGDVPARAASGE